MLDFTKAEFTTAYGNASQLKQGTIPEFVFAGRSNVGKSSLINKLCNRKRLARVSSTPGKTATINYYKAGQCFLVDLPGYGYAKTSFTQRKLWDSLINAYFSAKPSICLLLQLLDCRHAPSKDDIHMLEYLRHYEIPFVAVLTKADKCKPAQHAGILAGFESVLQEYGCKTVLLVSAEKGQGLSNLRNTMLQSVGEECEDGIQ